MPKGAFRLCRRPQPGPWILSPNESKLLKIACIQEPSKTLLEKRVVVHDSLRLALRNLGTTPILKKNALGVNKSFSEQLSEFRGILGAILGMALTT